MAKIPVAEYQTPAGYYDLPYIYVYDGDALTDGVNYANVNVGVADFAAGFALRQIMGMQNLATRIQLRDSFAPLTGASAGIAMPPTYPIAPGRFITPAGSLTMDLFGVARAFRVVNQAPLYFAQMAFQGVRRYLGSSQNLGQSTYRYTERSFTYVQPVTVNWLGTDASARKYSVAITEGCDFELQRITIIRTSQGGVVADAVPNCELKLQFFDQQSRRLSNAPVLDVYLNDAADAATNLYNVTFPVPSLLYERQSFIRFEVTSLLAVQPATYDIYFQGIRRVEA